MLFTKAAICLSSLVLLVAAQDSEDAFIKSTRPALGRTPNPLVNRLMTRDLTKRCTGTCEECFGDGYTLCPGSSIFCYKPGDPDYGLDSCSSSGSDSGTATSTATGSSATGTSGVDDICYQAGATCVSCFGSGYLDCPDGYHCYNPDDPLYDTCPDSDTSGSGSGSGSGSSSNSSSCESLYGSGSIDCGSDSCYNPTDGDVCCEDGYHCENGYTCASVVGKCCAPGSTSSYCTNTSGSGGLLSATSTFGATFSTSSATLQGSSATSTGSSSSTTSSSSLTDSGNGAGMLGVQKGLMIAVGVGALVL